MSRNTLVWAVAVSLVFGASLVILAVFVLRQGTAADVEFSPTQAPPISAADWKRGASAPKVTIIEYGDFQCPACGQYEPVVQQLEQEYGDRVQFVFRNFPLSQIHPNATAAAQAAEAAGVQGKYWEMHDLLYQKQSEWAERPSGSVAADYFEQYAQAVGLDLGQFRTDMKSSAVKAKMDADLAGGASANVNHTPTFFVNLTQIQNPSNYADFKFIIDASIASSSAP